MARLARVVLPGVPHHITQRGVRSMIVFSDDEDKQHYLDLLQSASEDHGFEVISYCLMSNHVHLLVIPEKEESLRKGIGMVHRYYSRMVNIREKTRGYLFQGRFFSCPLDDAHLSAALKYVELNPIRAGLCKNAGDYHWSSARYYLGLDEENQIIKNRDWYGNRQDWEELLKENPKEINTLRKYFRTGRPLGSEQFLKEAEQITSRELIPKKPGRKRKSQRTK